jgi:hypothetical protein
MTMKSGPDGKTKLPVLRPEGTVTPCWKCPKIPVGSLPKPENAVELSAHNREAWHHYLECRAVGVFPDDPIVRRNAAAIREVYDLVETTRWQTLTTAVMMLRYSDKSESRG